MTNNNGAMSASVGVIMETGKHHPLMQHTTAEALAGMILPSCIHNPPLSARFPFPLKNQITLTIGMINCGDEDLRIVDTYICSLELSIVCDDP